MQKSMRLQHCCLQSWPQSLHDYRCHYNNCFFINSLCSPFILSSISKTSPLSLFVRLFDDELCSSLMGCIHPFCKNSEISLTMLCSALCENISCRRSGTRAAGVNHSTGTWIHLHRDMKQISQPILLAKANRLQTHLEPAWL